MTTKINNGIIADLHTHCSDSYGLNWNLPGLKRRSYSKTKIPEELVLQCAYVTMGEEADGTLVGLINFDDHRGQGILEGIKRLEGGIVPEGGRLEVTDDLKYALRVRLRSGFYPEKNLAYIIGQEVPTNKGHILVVGAEGDIQSRELSNTLKEARDLGGLVFVDHFGAKLGLFARAVYSAFGGNPRISLSEGDIYLNTQDGKGDLIHGVEVWNGNYGLELFEAALKTAKQHGLLELFVSDAHRVGDVLKSYVRFRELDFTSLANLRKSILAGLGEKRAGTSVISAMKNGIFEGKRHGIATCLGLALVRVGFVKEKEIMTK